MLELNFPDEAVSDRTVRQILHRDLHFKFGKLTEVHKQNRVVWSLLHAEDGRERTLFLDDSCYALTPNGVRSWYPDGNRAQIFEAEQFSKKLHVLGAISSVGTVGPLVFAPPGQAWAAERVIVALNENILPMADAWFGHGNFHIDLDNATPHTANARTQFAQVEGVDLLFQSANSPDMQPIENVCGLMKDNISRRDDIATTDDLRQALEEEWPQLGPEEVAPFVESMGGRMTECLAAGGGHTHYYMVLLLRAAKFDVRRARLPAFFSLVFFFKTTTKAKTSKVSLPACLLVFVFSGSIMSQPSLSHFRLQPLHMFAPTLKSSSNAPEQGMSSCSERETRIAPRHCLCAY